MTEEISHGGAEMDGMPSILIPLCLGASGRKMMEAFPCVPQTLAEPAIFQGPP